MKNTLIVAIVAVSVLAVTIATAGAVATTGSVTGGGSGAFPAPFGPLAGDRLSVVLTARTLPTGTISGRFQLVHRGKDGGLMAELSGRVDCLVISSGQVSATGTITAGIVPEAPGVRSDRSNGRDHDRGSRKQRRGGCRSLVLRDTARDRALPKRPAVPGHRPG